MRKKEVAGIINDLLDFGCWKNPIHSIFIEEKIIFDLLTGNCSEVEKTSMWELLQEKRNWFLDRIKNLNGSLSDFEKAAITIYGREEKVDVIYKGEKFSKSFVAP